MLSPIAVQIAGQARASLHQIAQDFELSTDRLNAIVAKFLIEFDRGLQSDEDRVRDGSSNGKNFMPMIPTYVRHIPDGSETGRYLALDLGGTNLRTCEVTLKGDHTWAMKQHSFKVSESLKTGHVSDLFDYIASSVAAFLDEIANESGGSASKATTADQGEVKAPKDDSRLPLGFTFSFPVESTAINRGKLIHWTKGFECAGAVGKDVVCLLQDALDRQKINVQVVSLVNDTAGTLMARAYASGDCLCGAIFGTGTNGAYVERLDRIGKLEQNVDEAKEKGLEYMVVNTEWGAFDNDREVLRFSSFDEQVDRTSINPGKQAYEKMVSGLYLGEVTRVIILHLIEAQAILQGQSSDTLNTHYGLDTATLSALESPSIISSSASKDAFSIIRKILVKDVKLSEDSIAESDAFAIARVSEIVTTRAARLSACAIAAIIKRVGDRSTYSFGFDGALIEHLPLFEHRVRIALQEILGKETESKVEIGLAKDGSGVGAALCAHAASKQQAAGL